MVDNWLLRDAACLALPWMGFDLYLLISNALHPPLPLLRFTFNGGDYLNMVTYWTQDESVPGHLAVFAVDMTIILATFYAVWALHLSHRNKVLIVFSGVATSLINCVLTLVLDLKLFGHISNRLYLGGAVFYFWTWLVYLYLIKIESVVLGKLSRKEEIVLYIALAISAFGALPGIAFFLYATIVGYSFVAVYYFAIPVVLFNPVFDLVVLFFLYRKVYQPREWNIPGYLILSVTVMVSLKIWLLVIVATPSLPLYCQFEEVAMHIAFLNICMIFLNIQKRLREKNLNTLPLSYQDSSMSVGVVSQGGMVFASGGSIDTKKNREKGEQPLHATFVVDVVRTTE